MAKPKIPVCHRAIHSLVLIFWPWSVLGPWTQLTSIFVELSFFFLFKKKIYIEWDEEWLVSWSNVWCNDKKEDSYNFCRNRSEPRVYRCPRYVHSCLRPGGEKGSHLPKTNPGSALASPVGTHHWLEICHLIGT